MGSPEMVNNKGDITKRPRLGKQFILRFRGTRVLVSPWKAIWAVIFGDAKIGEVKGLTVWLVSCNVHGFSLTYEQGQHHIVGCEECQKVIWEK